MPLAEIESRLKTTLEREHVILTSSGRLALTTLLVTSGLSPDAEVMIPAICCPAVLQAIQLAGFQTVLADVDPETLNMNLNEIKKAITPETKVILAVHNFGRPCDITEIIEYAKENDLLVIEDACLALGGQVGGEMSGQVGAQASGQVSGAVNSQLSGRPVGSFGEVSIVSFGYDKPVAVNYGGAIATNCPEQMKKITEFLKRNEFFSFTPLKERDEEIINKLDELPSYVQTRIENAAFYKNNIDWGLYQQLPAGEDIAYWRYPLYVKADRDKLIRDAKQKDIIFTKHYQSLARFMTEADCPNAAYIEDHILNLFVRAGTTDKEKMQAVAFLNEYSND